MALKRAFFLDFVWFFLMSFVIRYSLSSLFPLLSLFLLLLLLFLYGDGSSSPSSTSSGPLAYWWLLPLLLLFLRLSPSSASNQSHKEVLFWYLSLCRNMLPLLWFGGHISAYIDLDLAGSHL